MKLSTKLTLLVLMAVLLPLLGLGGAVYIMQKKVTEERLQQQLQQQGIAAIQHIRDHLLENYRDLALVAGSSTLRPTVWTPEYGLNRYLASFPMYDALIYTDQKGKLIAHAGSPLLTEGDASLEQAASDWHQAALAGVKVIDRVTPKPGAMPRYLVFARQVSDPGIVHGWVFAQVNSEKIVDIIEQAKIGETGHITLFNRNGILVGHPNKSRYGSDMSAYPIMRKPLAEGMGDSGNFFVSGDGREKWGLTMMLSDHGELANLRWGIIVDQTRDELYGPLVDLRNTILLGATAFGIAFTFFGIFFARRLIAPLFSIKRNLLGFFGYLSGKADPPAHLGIAGNDELAQMAQAIDESIEVAALNISKAREVETARDEALSRLNKIAARLPGVVFQLRMRPDGGLSVPYASDAIKAIYRLKAEDLHDDASPIFSVVHPDDLAGHMTSIRTSAQELLPWQNEYRLKFADGTERWLYGNATPERERDGSTLWHGFVTDITEQKRAEIERQESARRYQTIIQASFDGYWLVDLEGRLIDANESAAVMLGYTREAMLGLGVKDIDTIDTPADIRARVERMLKSGGERFETKHRKQSGEIIDIEASISLLPDGSAFVVFVHDITERKLANLALEESESAFRKVLEASNEGVLLLDSRGVFVECNQAALDLLKMTREQFIHMTPDQISVEFQPNGRRSEEYAPEMTALGWKGFHRFEWACRNLEGEEFIVEVSLMPIILKGQRMLHCTWRDITERKQMEEQVRQLAFYDTLTLLPNRRLLHDRLSLALATSKRNRVYGALLFLDLDNFKPLNDTHGHDVGDLLLIEAARRLQSCVRAIDTVSRFGGDEFVVVISELEPTLDKSVEQARKIAEKICAALSETYFLTGARQASAAAPIEHHCTVSIGVEMFFEHVEKSEELMKRADAAMYRAKEAGRNQVQFGDPI